MADMSIMRTVLRTLYRPCPRSVQAGEVAAAAAAIERMTASAELVQRTSRAAALDDLAEAR
jgi:hypothetical protein